MLSATISVIIENYKFLSSQSPDEQPRVSGGGEKQENVSTESASPDLIMWQSSPWSNLATLKQLDRNSFVLLMPCIFHPRNSTWHMWGNTIRNNSDHRHGPYAVQPPESINQFAISQQQRVWIRKIRSRPRRCTGPEKVSWSPTWTARRCQYLWFHSRKTL